MYVILEEKNLNNKNNLQEEGLGRMGRGKGLVLFYVDEDILLKYYNYQEYVGCRSLLVMKLLFKKFCFYRNREIKNIIVINSSKNLGEIFRCKFSQEEVRKRFS